MAGGAEDFDSRDHIAALAGCGAGEGGGIDVGHRDEHISTVRGGDCGCGIAARRITGCSSDDLLRMSDDRRCRDSQQKELAEVQRGAPSQRPARLAREPDLPAPGENWIDSAGACAYASGMKALIDHSIFPFSCFLSCRCR
jgi:hypothetical protein